MKPTARTTTAAAAAAIRHSCVALSPPRPSNPLNYYRTASRPICCRRSPVGTTTAASANPSIGGSSSRPAASPIAIASASTTAMTPCPKPPISRRWASSSSSFSPFPFPSSPSSSSSPSSTSARTAWLLAAAGSGAALLALALADSPSTIHADAAAAAEEPIVRATATTESVEDDGFKIEPETKERIPTELRLRFPRKEGPPAENVFYLLGFGVRQVTMLYFNVYVVAMYADQGSLAGIRHSPKWKTYTPTAVLKGTEDSYYAKDFVRRPGCELSLLLRPVRQTTGVHLRQGFSKFLNDTLAREVKSGALKETGSFPAGTTEEDRKALASAAIKELEAKFPIGPVDKGQSFIFTKRADGSLRFEMDGRELGVIQSKWLAERFFEGYLAHEKPISNKLRVSVAEGLRAVPKDA
ncbi:chalcone-flavanone isomerase-domain-containing protein [Zopfochytrium polystomum]|nr:chalcone-flavanone isomerase-domain-containing protein [Zopfochytrium polystomum]